jgi:hypothetical protein
LFGNQRCINFKALRFDIHLGLDKVIGDGRIMFRGTSKNWRPWRVRQARDLIKQK